MSRPSFLTAAGATLVLAATLTGAGRAPVATAQADPATDDMTIDCRADGASEGTVAGSPAVSPGERITVTSVLRLDAGQLYQDAVARPDGSTYFASAIELAPTGDAGATLDAATARFTIGETETPFTIGSQPSPDGYVLDTSGGRLRLYFPGDADAMLADVGGAGLPSVVVAADDTRYELAATATIAADETIVTGRTIDVATCRSSLSTGPAARSSDERTATVGVAEPRVTIAKTVAPPTVSPGSIATFTIHVTNAEDQPDAPVAPAYDVEVVDTLPAELVPVNGSGAPMNDGATSAGGLRWDASDRTLRRTLDRVDPGDSVDLDVRVRLEDTTPAATDVVNDASATATSTPGPSTTERVYPAVEAQATLRSADATPRLTKVAEHPTTPTNSSIGYTVTLTLPPSSTYENVSLVDVLPVGTAWQQGQIDCTGCDGGLNAIDLGVDTPGGTQRTGMYLGHVATGSEPATITWTYHVDLGSSFPDGSPIPQGTSLDNAVAFRANIIDRLGGVTPPVVRPA